MSFRKKLLCTAGAVVTVVGLGAGLGASHADAATVCTSTSPTGGCGPFSDPNVFTSSNGADLVVQNDFSAIPQTLTAPADNDWTVAASTVGQQDQTSVKSYPATQVTYTLTNGMPDPSSDFGSTLTSDFANVVPSGSGQDYEFAADDWLADPSKPSWTNDLEIMIWTHVNGQRPAGNDTGKVYTDAAGTQWEVWVAGGATTVSPDSTVSFVRKTNTDSGSFERMGFYKYLQGQGMLSATYGIDQLNYGLEICSTGGATRTYGISNYTTVVNGTVTPPPPAAPVVSAAPATAVSQTGATLNGSVNPEGADTSASFEYGTTTAYGSITPAADAGSGSAAVSEAAPVTGLQPATTYHYRLDATNATGTTDGADGTFTTPAVVAPQAPVVAPAAASGLSQTGATLNGSVNPEGQSTSYQFEYGTDTTYGSTAPATPGDAGSGSAAVNESAAVTGLTANTTYHYRLNAVNAAGTTNGADGTFTTAAVPTAQVAFDASGGAKAANKSAITWTQMVGSGANRDLVAEWTVGVSNDAGCSASVTDNGVKLTELKAVGTNNMRAGVLTVWQLVNPPSGLNTLTATTSHCTGGVPAELTAGSESFSGVSQAAPNGTVASAFGSGTTAAVSAASVANGMEAGFAANGSAIASATAPSSSKFTENQNDSTGAGNSAGATSAATGNAVAMKWNVQNDWWGVIQVPVLPA